MNVRHIFHQQTLGMFAREVIAYAEMQGWKVWRLKLGQERAASLLVLTRRPRVVWAVLRPERVDIRTEQLDLMVELAEARQEAYVWRPSTWRQVEQVLTWES